MKAEGWFLYRATDDELERGVPATLVRESFELGKIEANEVLAAPLFGCWEGNMGHAIARKPIDLCRARGEPRLIIGNAGVVAVLEVGKSVKGVRPGQRAVIFCNGEEDWFGYPKTILGYDAPNTMGCLATRMKVKERQLIPIPENTRYSLEQWASFSLRYITAWSNWEMALGVYRLAVSADELAAINVWGWGGGVSYAELDLARRHGCRTAMLSASDAHLETIKQTGILPIDRRQFGPLEFDHKRYKKDAEYTQIYQESENRFLAKVDELTHGRKVQIFIDMIGEPVYRATIKALAREGVITTSGWKEGMQIHLTRAIECIERHQHIHTHYARYAQGWKAVAFAEGNGWLPPHPQRVYSFDEIPKLAAEYQTGEVEMFPTFSINET